MPSSFLSRRCPPPPPPPPITSLPVCSALPLPSFSVLSLSLSATLLRVHFLVSFSLFWAFLLLYWVASELPGDLPLTPLTPKDSTFGVDCSIGSFWGSSTMTVENRKGGFVGGDEGSRDPFPAGMRVLAVDDDPACLKILENLLMRCKYHGLINLTFFFLCLYTCI